MNQHRRLLDLQPVKDVALTDVRVIEPVRDGETASTTSAVRVAPLWTNASAAPAPPLLTVDGPGIYDGMSAEQYHADPCPEPSLSSSIAKLICLSSPIHARHAHPRLTPTTVDDHAEHFDIGTAAHAVLLEGEAAIEVIHANDFRTNAAKDQRDAARLAGKTPLLAKRWADVQAMVRAARAQLDAHTDGGAAMFTNGKPEQTLIWREPDGTWCRARADWLRPGNIDDFKTGHTANPEQWTRSMFALGFDLQAAWYLRGLKVLTGEDVTFRFAVIETTPPYALSVIALGPDVMTIAEKKVIYALEQWATCRRTGKWPGYPTRTCWATLPPWEEAKWIEREQGVSDKELL